MPDVNIDVYTKTHGSEQALGGVKEGLNGVQQGADGAEKSTGGLWKQFALGAIVVDAAKKAGRGFVDLLRDSISAAAEDERTQVALNTAIEMTGRSRSAVGKTLEDFAARMEKATLYTDEEVRSAAALLVQMTDLDANGIQRAIKGSMGLATVMGIDLQSATSLVMKALEGNFGALSRYGIKVDENLTAGEKQVALLEQLEGMYGRATAAIEPYSGKVAQLSKEWENSKEALGRAVLQTGILQAGTEILTGAMEALQEGLKSKTQKVKEAVEAQRTENEANNEAYESLVKMADALDWPRVKLANLARQYDLTYVEMMEWVQGNLFGVTAADALAEATGRLTSEEDSYYQLLKNLGIPTLTEERAAQEERKEKIDGLKKALDAGVISQEQYTEAVKKFTPEADNQKAAIEAAKKEAEEYTSFLNSLGIYTQQQQAEQFRLSTKALEDLDRRLAAGKITQEQYEKAVLKVNEGLRKYGIIVDTALPPARDLQAVWDKCPKTLKDLDGELKTAEQLIEEAGNAMGYSAATAQLMAYELVRLTLAAQGIVLPDLRIPDSQKMQVQRDVDDIKGMWDGLMNDVSHKWGETIGDFLEGETTLVTTWNRMWRNLWDTVKDYLGKKISEFIVDKMKDIISSSKNAGDKASEALGGIGTTVSSVAQTVGEAISSIATAILDVVEDIATTVIDIVAYGLTTLAEAIATAATSLAAAAPSLLIVGGIALALYAGFSAINALIGSGGGGSGDGMGRVVERLDDFLAGWHWWYLDVVAILSFIQGQNDHRADQLDTINGTIHMWGAEIRDAVWGVRDEISGLAGASAGAVSTQTQLMMIHGTPDKPEYIIPHDNLGNFIAGAAFRRAPGEGSASGMSAAVAPAAGASQAINISISGPLIQATSGLSDSEIQRAGEKLLSTIEYELRRSGRKLAYA